MDETLKISESTYDLDEYFANERISQSTIEKLNLEGIIAIPNKYAEKEYYFAQETIEFIKYCRENEKEHTVDLLADGDIKTRSLHSFDIWLPIIWIGTKVLLPVVFNLVSNYIYEKMRGREHEEAKVDVSIIVCEGEKKKEIRYSGDAKTFKEVFGKIDIHNL